MSTNKVLIPLFLLVLAAACGQRDAILGSGAKLTTKPCATCTAADRPTLVCAKDQTIACFERTDGTCGWAEACSGTPPGGGMGQPPGPTCTGPTCDIYCQYGHQKDKDGCALCGCNAAPADGGSGGSPGPNSCAPEACAGQPVDLIACANGPTRHTCEPLANGSCGWKLQCDPPGPNTCAPEACAGQPVDSIACANGPTRHACEPAANGGCRWQLKCTDPPVTCGPVCAIYCAYGNVKDANGCDTCACNPAPAIWGGKGITLRPRKGGADVVFDCASGTIEGVLPTAGSAVLPGTYASNKGPSMLVPPPAPARAEYTIEVKGTTMSLRVRLLATDPAFPEYILMSGVAGDLNRCL